MKKLLTIIQLFVFILSVHAQNQSESTLFAGTFTSEGAEGIYVCRFDNQSGKLSLQKVFKGIDNPSFLTLSPDRQYLYAVTRPAAAVEPSGGYVQSYRIDAENDLHFINKQVSNGADPCHIDITTDGKKVAIATYGGGTVSVYQVSPNGSLNKADITINNTGSGPNKQRQTAPHAHSVLFTPDDKQLFSADLGTDKISIFDVSDGKIISANQSYLALEPGAGPRHITFHPDARTLYVINELNSTITVFRKSRKKWKQQQAISTLPDDFTGESFCADIHVSPDGQYLYGSNRGHNSIAVFAIDNKTKKLSLKTTVHTEGDWPRNFTISPDGKFLLAANQRSGNVTVFKLNAETGVPEFTGNELKIPAPVCLVFK